MALASSSQGVDLDGNAERLKEAILATSAAALSAAVDRAIAANVVSASYAERSKADLARLEQLATQATLLTPKFFGKTSLGSVLDLVSIKPGLQAEFGQLYSSAVGAARRTFWTDLAKNPAFPPAQVADLHFGVTVGRLTRGHLPLITELVAQRKAGTISHARDLARLTADDWLALLQKPVNGTPIGIPAGFSQLTGELGAQRYAATLERSFTRAYPTPAFSARLARDPKPTFAHSGQLASFLDANPSFDLRLTNVDSFTKTAPIEQQLQPSLLAAQRLVKLNSNYSVMSALKADGLHSAQQVYMMGRDRFVATYGQLAALGPTEAARTFAKAEQTYGVALAVATRLNATLLASSPAAVGGPLPADTANQIAGFPNLQTLFGAESLCECEECQSVLGDAAYLADMLDFLGKRGASGAASALAVLLKRRPDLAQIELNCENTDTELPYIDLVNELLEEAVAPDDPAATPARKRQTTLTTPELDANPEYLNETAYQQLAKAVFPWSLPFDLPLTEARTYLGSTRSHSRRTDHRLSEAQPAARRRSSNCSPVERLGLSSRRPKSSRRTARDGYEGVGMVGASRNRAKRCQIPKTPRCRSPADWEEILARVSLLLARAGLSYQELVRLLNSTFVNPAGAIAISPALCARVQGQRHGARRPRRKRRSNVSTASSGCGDASAGASTTSMPRSRRCRRNEPEGAARLNPLLLRQLAAIADAMKRYGLSVQKAVALLAPQPGAVTIATREAPTPPGDEPVYSLYHELFENKTVLNPPDEHFKLNGTRTAIEANPAPPLSEHRPALIAALGISESELAFAITKLPDQTGSLTLANLSALFATAQLASMLQVNVEGLAIADRHSRGATHAAERIKPFSAKMPESLERFADYRLDDRLQRPVDRAGRLPPAWRRRRRRACARTPSTVGPDAACALQRPRADLA